jgi:trehalose-6-phosphatase
MARHLGTFAHGILAAYPQPDFLFAAGDDRTDEGLFERNQASFNSLLIVA